MDELDELYESIVFSINEKYIIDLNAHSHQGQINNVVTGLEEKFYSLSVIDDEKILRYDLIFGTNKNGLNGMVLKLDSTIKERDELTFMFAKSITEEYKNLNIIDVFNTFQRHVRSMFEKYEFMTYNPRQFKDLPDRNPIIMAKGVRGLIPVLEIDRIDFYKDFFDYQTERMLNDGEEHVYLMYNARNNLIKIGQSIHPNFREKTLQSEEPEIVLLAIWQAPKTVEKELHKTYNEKRMRGEWFELTFNDLKDIKEKMSKY